MYHMSKTCKFEFLQHLKGPYYDVIDNFIKFWHLDIRKFILGVENPFD